MHPVPLHRVVPYALAEQCGLGCREANRRLAHGADVELCLGVVEMKRDGTAGDTENAADLPGGLALGGPPEAFELARRQRHAPHDDPSAQLSPGLRWDKDTTSAELGYRLSVFVDLGGR